MSKYFTGPVDSGGGTDQNTDFYDDDTVSSSDGSFMPPVLSDYGNALLSEHQAAVAAAAAAAQHSNRFSNGSLLKRSGNANFQQIAGNQSANHQDLNRTSSSYLMESNSFRISNGQSSPHNKTTQFHSRHTEGTSPRVDQRSHSPHTKYNTPMEELSSNSARSSDSPYSDHIPVQGVSTPGITRATSANKINSDPTSMPRSSVRVKRFGRGLGPPKRAVRRESQEGSSEQESNGDKASLSQPDIIPTLSSNSAHQPPREEDMSPIKARLSRIRFAVENEEIPPSSSDESQQPSISQKNSSSLSSPILISTPYGQKHSETVSRSPKDQDNSKIPNRPSSRSALTPISPNKVNEVAAKVIPPPKMDNLQPVIKETSNSYRQEKRTKNIISVNGRSYQRLELIGRGGSSKVYKAQMGQAGNSKVYAIKKVTFDDLDRSVIDGFKGEIDLLLKLRSEDRVVKLIDHELTERTVFLVMECGEIDLAHVLNARLNQPLDMSFVRYYTTEMLHCVEAVHRHGIVHSDLKPANFLLVKGMLKIIDFGIANVVPDYTSNVHRDTQIGTPNYMAPEALLDSNGGSLGGKSHFKVGTPSDVWSCGCIIYQMIYGRPPYGNYGGPQRLLAIMNPKVQIEYPANGTGQIKVHQAAIESIKGCLIRDPNQRMTVQQVLDGPFLSPQAVTKQFIADLVANAVKYGANNYRENLGTNEINLLTADVWSRIQALNQ